VKPTWGVSFGLPQTGGAGPIAPHAGYSLGTPGYTPGYGLVSGQGINLGPVSVNPLVAVQVTKDDYGEKVVKPYVNLHVTPNPGLFHKLGHLLAYKKYGAYGGGPYGGQYGVYAPHYHTHHVKPVHHYTSPPLHYPPHPHHHGPHHSHPTYYKPHGGYYPSEYYKDDNDDYDDYSDYSDYADDYYRNAGGRRALTKEDRQSAMGKDSPKSSGEDVGRSNGKITFTDRKKRDVSAFNETTEVRTGGQCLLASSNRLDCCRDRIEPLIRLSAVDRERPR